MGYSASASPVTRSGSGLSLPPPVNFDDSVRQATLATAAARASGGGHAQVADANQKWNQVYAAAEGELRRAAVSDPSNPVAAVEARKLQLLASVGQEEKPIVQTILDTAQTTVLGETPDQREARVTLEDAQTQYGTAAREWQVAQGWSESQRQANPHLQQRYLQAQTNFQQAERNLLTATNDVIDADLDAKLQELYGPAPAGGYTPDQIKATSTHVTAGYGGDPATAAMVDYRAAVLGQGQKAQEWLDRILADPDALNLTDAERQLAQSDPVILAFLKAAGVMLELDPAKDATLSPEEIELGREDPALLAFMRLGGVEIWKHGDNLRITIGGKPHTLTPQQQTAYKQGGMTGLAIALGDNIQLTPETQALIDSGDDIRMKFATDRLPTLPEQERLAFINTQLNGFFSPNMRRDFWDDHGMPAIRPWLETSIGNVRAEEGNEQAFLTYLGQHMDGLLDGATPEVANLMLDIVKARVEQGAPEDIPLASSQVFMQALSKAVFIADQGQPGPRAAEFGDWLATSDLSLIDMNTPSEFQQIIGQTGHWTLGDALATSLEGRKGDYVDHFPEDMRRAVTDGSTAFGVDRQEQERRDTYRAFMDPAVHNQRINEHFDQFRGVSNLGVPMSTQNTPELRNTIGRALGLEPNQSPDAVARGDLSVDWYAEGTVPRVYIDLVGRWIDSEDDPGAKVTVVPVIYASERDSVQYGALFKITRSDGSEVLIDGLAVDDAVFTAAHEQNIDLGDPVNLSRLDLSPDKIFVNWRYDNFGNFVDKNQYDDDGKIYMPKDWRLADADKDGHIDWTEEDAARFITGEKWKLAGDIGALVVGTVGGILLIPVSGGTSTALIAGTWAAVGVSTGYQVYRSWDMYNEATTHGQSGSWDNPGTRNSALMAGTAAFSMVPLATSSRGAFLMGSGRRMIQGGDAAAGASQLDAAAPWMTTARWTGYPTAAAGTYFVGSQGYSLATNWNNMSWGERATGITFTVFGAGQLGLAAVPHVARSVSSRPGIRGGQNPATLRAGQQGAPVRPLPGGGGGGSIPPGASQPPASGRPPMAMRYTRFDSASGQYTTIDTSLPRGQRAVPLDTPYSGEGLQTRIRERAHLLSEDAGHPTGRELDFWLTAQRQILDEDALTLGVPRDQVDPQLRVSDGVHLIWRGEAMPNGRHAEHWNAAEGQIYAARDPAYAGPWARVSQNDIGDALFYDPKSQRYYGLNHETGEPTFFSRAGEANSTLPARPSNLATPSFADGTRYFSEIYNREFVYSSSGQRFEPLDAGGAELYNHPTANQTFIRNGAGGFDFWGVGDNRAVRTPDWAPPAAKLPDTPPAGADWYFDSISNRTYAVDYRTGRFRPLTAPEHHLTYFDAETGSTYTLDLGTGRLAFFGRGDNTRGWSMPADAPQLMSWQEGAPDFRAGFAARGRPKPGNLAWEDGPDWQSSLPGTGEGNRQPGQSEPRSLHGSPTVVSGGYSVGTKSNFRAIGRGFIDSLRTRSRAPLRDSMTKSGQVSLRSREFRNQTFYQWGILPVSSQTVIQYKGSTLLKHAEAVVLHPDVPVLKPGELPEAAFDVTVHSATKVGRQAQGPHEVVELSISLNLRTGTRSGSTDIDVMGVRDPGLVQLPHGAPFSKVMTETRVGQPVWLRIIPLRLSGEVRPEFEVPGGIPARAEVNQTFLAQNDAALATTDLRIQLVVTDPVAVTRLQEAPTLATVHELIRAGQIDPNTAFSYVPPHVLSGLRLSAIPGKPAYQTATDLTGQRRTVWHPDQSNLDVVFNDAIHLPGGGRVRNPEIWVDKAGYWIKTRLSGTGLARWAEGTPLRRLGLAHPQPHYMNSPDIYSPFRAGQGPVAVRYTLVWSTPNIWGVGSAELRFSYKTSPDTSAPTRGVAEPAHSGVALPNTQGGFTAHFLPGWFATMLTHDPHGPGVMMPKGGRAVIEGDILPRLAEDATPPQQQAIDWFRSDILPNLNEGGYVPSKTLEDLGVFFSRMNQR